MRTLTLSALFLATAALAADPAPKPIPGLKAAQDAYDKEMLIAKELHSRTVREARAEYVKALKAIQVERTKTGDLDGAVKVKEMIAGVESEEPSEPKGMGIQIHSAMYGANISWLDVTDKVRAAATGKKVFPFSVLTRELGDPAPGWDGTRVLVIRYTNGTGKPKSLAVYEGKDGLLK